MYYIFINALVYHVIISIRCPLLKVKFLHLTMEGENGRTGRENKV